MRPSPSYAKQQSKTRPTPTMTDIYAIGTNSARYSVMTLSQQKIIVGAYYKSLSPTNTITPINLMG